MNRTLTTLIASTALAAFFFGCSPESYQRSADLQVADILRDRKQETLAYDPQTEVETNIPIKTTKASYAKIPTSPIPPPTTSPIEPERIVLPSIPLGPETYWEHAVPATTQPTASELLDRRTAQQSAMGPPAPDHVVRNLDLFGCIEYGVQHSRPYQNQMEGLYLAALDVTLQRHLLSPRPFVQQRLNYAGGQQTVDYRSALTATTSAGMRQKLPYGGEVVAESLVTFVDAINDSVNDSESAQVALSASVPLLRGAGMVNLEPLISSEREMVYQVRAFEDYRRAFVVGIAAQYFNLLAQQQGVINRRLSVANLASLTERTQALYDAGRLNFLEVQRALQSQLQAEASLIDAMESYQSALDAFKLTLGAPLTERIDVAAVELDVTVPKATEDDAIAAAQRYRLDLRTASDQIEDAQRGVKNARNSLLPSLDFNARAQVDNEDPDRFKSLDARTATYSAGLTLDLPVDRVVERNLYRASLIALQRAQRSWATLRDQVTAQVRESLRSIRAAEVSVLIQQRGIELAQRRLEYSNELLRQGKINARDVVESQTSLLDAQDGYERARSQLQIRILEYMRDTGTLRVDPKAGALGRAMDRAAVQARDAALNGKH